MLGIVLAITASFCWGAGAIFTRLGLQNIKVSAGAFISMLSSVLLVGLLTLAMNFDDVVHLSPAALLWFALVGIVNFVLGRQFNFAAIRYIGVTKASPLFAAAPLFAMLLALIFLGESVNVAIIIGTLVLVPGLYLVVTSG
jgi:drug/metabolite transporter (DMT)-like permease|tara:strand:+ start:553 stop:975 length:423 start_codon:yes stop_codon:yes gene_type:complete